MKIYYFFSLPVMVAVLLACSPDDRKQTPKVSSEPHAGDAVAAGQPNARASANTLNLSWQTPSGWTEVDPTPTRKPNFTIAGQPDVECYVTILSGHGGGVLPNLNRWRGQMGLESMTEEALNRLPTIPLLGQQARFIEMEGSFKGMEGEARPGYKMLGAVAEYNGQAVFVKMVGPAEAVTRQTKAFKKMCASLAVKQGQPPANTNANHDFSAMPNDSAHSGLQTMPHDAIHSNLGMTTRSMPLDATHANLRNTSGTLPADMIHSMPMDDLHKRVIQQGAAPASAPFDASRLTWEAPAGWKQEPERPMRIASFKIGPRTECYLTVIGGAAGGIEGNVNRWRGQMGLAPLSGQEIQKLEKIPLLNQQGILVEMEGTFKGMEAEAQSGYALLGAIVKSGKYSVFVKLTGPAGEVKAQRENFIRFCQSLKLK